VSKYFVFASDARSYLDLVNVVKELQNKNEEYFFLYNLNPFTVDPKTNLNAYNYDTNIQQSDKNKPIVIPTLGFELPFTPDFTLITRENWVPEKDLVLDFKKIGSLVCCVENSNWLYNHIKTRLELLSRMTFPSNLIDVHFDHSDWEFETKKLAGWVNNKTKVVGNPKFDNVFDNIDIDYIIDKYDLNQNKKNVLVYGSMEHEMRTNLFSELKHMRDNLSNDFEILYRPHPAEFLKFKDEFNPNFCIDGVKVIDNDMDVKSISNFSDFHVSMFQGVAYNSLIYDKKLIIHKDNFGVRDELNLDVFKEKEFPFWSNIFGISSWDEFKDLIDLSLLEQFIERYDKWWKNISNSLDVYDKDLKWSLDTTPSKNNSQLLKYFDDFNDQNASRRIVESMNKMKGM
jgi:hypothetical protein